MCGYLARFFFGSLFRKNVKYLNNVFLSKVALNKPGACFATFC